MSNSPQDEGGPDTSNPQGTPRIYETRRTPVVIYDQCGMDFQKMCALVFLRAVQSNSSFTMRWKDSDAGAFDDIVFTYRDRGKEQNILVKFKIRDRTTHSRRWIKEALAKTFYLKKSEMSAYSSNCTYAFFTNVDLQLDSWVANVDSPAKKLLCTTLKPEDVCRVHLTDDICEHIRNEPGAEDFVNRLLIFRNQSGVKYLDEFIKQELIKICNGFVPECQKFQQIFLEKIKAWWRKRTKTELCEKWNDWVELKEQLLCQNTLLKQIKFREDTLSHLEQRVFNSDSTKVLLKSESNEVQIACAKVYQTFIRKECHRALFTDISEPPECQNMLFSLWSKDVYDVLVITDVTKRCQNLGDDIAKYHGKLKNKIIVIVSSRDAISLGLLQFHEFGTDLIKSTFNQLDDKSQMRLKSLPVVFQGKEIELGSMNADRILEGRLLQDVLTSPMIQIGPALPARDGEYIPRTLSTKVVVNKKVLSSNDVLFIGGTLKYDLKKLIAEAKGEETLDEQWFSEHRHRYITMTSRKLHKTISGFKCCAKKLSEGPVHFLEVIDNSFYWIHSHGSTDNLFKFIEWCPREVEDCKKQFHEFGTDLIKSTFNQLDDKSQMRLKSLPVVFQGKEIELGSMNADRILEGRLLQDVLTSPMIQSGPALPARDGEYIPRTLSTKVVVNKKVLSSNDVLFIGGTLKYDLKKLIAEAKGEETLDEQWFSEHRHRYITMTSRKLHETISGFKCCAEKLSEGPVHFLEVIDNSFYWIHSHGSTDNLFKFIEWCPREEEDCKKQWCPREEEDCKKLLRDVKSSLAKEEDLVKKGFQTVIVADEPGSGKTALLREVAIKMKDLNPNRWIINTDLNKHSDTLDMIQQTGNVTPENVLELLSKAANIHDSELGKQLLKYYVLESGDICLLFDAFDEIAPLYTETVLAIFKLIRNNFRLSTLWIASRYNVKETLEIELKSKVFRIEPFCDEEQINFMSVLWGKEKVKACHKTLLDKLPFRVRSFPLDLKLFCETYPDLALSDNFSRISKSFSLINFYEQFIEKKLDIYFMKVGLNHVSAPARKIKERERKHFMESHMICSLVVMDMIKFLDEPHESLIKDEVEKICQNIVEGNERLGIIDDVVDGKPHFIHRSFAEHFAGKWLVKHWKGNEPLIRISALAPCLQSVYRVFCQELASELPAHLAVLNGDTNALEGLKDDLNKTDILGRTPLHLAVQIKDHDVMKMVVLELLKYGPELEIEDDLFGLTPLYYASLMESWDAIRIIVEHGAHVIRKKSNPEGDRNIIKAMEAAGVYREKSEKGKNSEGERNIIKTMKAAGV